MILTDNMKIDTLPKEKKQVDAYQVKHSFSELELATERLRAVAHPQRIQIIDMLHLMGEVNVTDIHNKLDIEQAVVSHHLRILKDRDVVKVRRDGKNSLYQLTNSAYYELIKIILSV